MKIHWKPRVAASLQIKMDCKTEVKKIKSKRCCVHDCKSKTGVTQVPFYHFPTDNKLFPHKVARRNACFIIAMLYYQ